MTRLLEQLRLVDTKSGFQPTYGVANFLQQTVIDALCADTNCMRILDSLIREYGSFCPRSLSLIHI